VELGSLAGQEGLKVPQKQPKRARRWLAEGSCLRRRPLYPNHVCYEDNRQRLAKNTTQ